MRLPYCNPSQSWYEKANVSRERRGKNWQEGSSRSWGSMRLVQWERRSPSEEERRRSPQGGSGGNQEKGWWWPLCLPVWLKSPIWPVSGRLCGVTWEKRGRKEANEAWGWQTSEGGMVRKWNGSVPEENRLTLPTTPEEDSDNGLAVSLVPRKTYSDWPNQCALPGEGILPVPIPFPACGKRKRKPYSVPEKWQQ